MNRYQKFALERMLNVYDFVRDNPGCSVMQLCIRFEIQSSTMRDNLKRLRESGHVTCEPGARSRAGQEPGAWSITAKDRPVDPPATKRRGKRPKECPIKQPAKIEDAKRIITRARQIGIARDWAVAAIFGDKAVACP